MILEFNEYIQKYNTPIYHFTTIGNIYKILDYYSDTKRLYLLPSADRVSFTRNYNMKSKELSVGKRCARITVNYDILSKNNKIKPFFDTIYKDDSEREERVYLNKKDVIDIKKSLIRIDILKEPVIDYTVDKTLNVYKFDDNEYVSNINSIFNKYSEYLNKIYNLKINDLPIYFVKNYKPATFIYNK